MKYLIPLAMLLLQAGDCLAQANVQIVQFASTGLQSDISDIENAGDQRLFITEQMGYIRIVQPNGTVLPRPFLDIHNKVTPLVIDSVHEQGLLGLAFSPNYATDGNFYVHYTDKTGLGNVVVARYHVSSDPDSADVASEQVLLRVFKPFKNHNGGCLQFGSEGYLYIGLGDGGAGGDPGNRAQNLDSLQGKILRIDVSGNGAYSIPPTNPFYGTGSARPEIWAYGLRNPWRFSFDRLTHDLWIADVGEQLWEEVNFQSASSNGGENYGWHCYEANQTYDTSGCSVSSAHVEPIFEYSHLGDTGCAITGGFVYRGMAYPDLRGNYFCADFCNGKVYGISADSTPHHWLAGSFAGKYFTTFGENSSGELFLGERHGRIFQLVSAPTAVREVENRSAEIKLYPIPSTGTFNVEVNSITEQKAEFQIKDALGKELFKDARFLHSGENSLQFDLQTLANGFYLLDVKGEHFAGCKRFLVVN